MDRAAAEQSLVNIIRDGENCGMGFLAPGDRVITARHCIDHARVTREKTVRISKFLDPAVTVEVVVEWFDENFEFDVAVLKPKPGEEAAFRRFARHLRPAPVQFSMPPLHQGFAVHLRRRDEGWASGTARLIEAEQQMAEIEGRPVVVVHQGTSGTPVFDDAGAAVGVAMLSAADALSYEGIQGGGEDKAPVFTPLASVLAPMKETLSRPAVANDPINWWDRILSANGPAAAVLVRLLVGCVFLSEGVQKFLFPDTLGAGRFVKIGIPYPEFTAPFVGVFEMTCGVLVLLGLLTRLAAVPLTVIMLVAIATTKVPILQEKGFWAMAHEARTDWSMLLGSLFLLLAGAGPWSLDGWLSRRRGRPG